MTSELRRENNQTLINDIKDTTYRSTLGLLTVVISGVGAAIFGIAGEKADQNRLHEDGVDGPAVSAAVEAELNSKIAALVVRQADILKQQQRLEQANAMLLTRSDVEAEPKPTPAMIALDKKIETDKAAFYTVYNDLTYQFVTEARLSEDATQALFDRLQKTVTLKVPSDGSTVYTGRVQECRPLYRDGNIKTRAFAVGECSLSNKFNDENITAEMAIGGGLLSGLSFAVGLPFSLWAGRRRKIISEEKKAAALQPKAESGQHVRSVRVNIVSRRSE